MPAPTVVSVNPASAEQDVVLGTDIVVTFDQALDVDTVTEATFSLTGPGQTQIFTPDQMSSAEPETMTGREYIPGAFSFSLNGSGHTVVRFTPARPLRKDVEYTVLILGGSSDLSSDAVANAQGDTLANSYEWSFKTGSLNLVVPPTAAPLPDQLRYLDTTEIVVVPRKSIGNDLSQQIQLIFPETIDEASVDLNALLVSIEPILGDLAVVVPEGLTATAVVSGRIITITVTGW